MSRHLLIFAFLALTAAHAAAATVDEGQLVERAPVQLEAANASEFASELLLE